MRSSGQNVGKTNLIGNDTCRKKFMQLSFSTSDFLILEISGKNAKGLPTQSFFFWFLKNMIRGKNVLSETALGFNRPRKGFAFFWAYMPSLHVGRGSSNKVLDETPGSVGTSFYSDEVI